MPPFAHSTIANPRRYFAALVGGVVVLGVALSFRVYDYGRQMERARVEAEFVRRSEVQAALARQTLDYYQSGAYALKSLFEGTDNVTREDFRRVATDILTRYPGIAAFEWVPIVREENRAAVEASVSREIGRPFQFSAVRSDGALIRDRDKPEYYPIVYVEPWVGNERAFGLDVKNAVTRPFAERARVTGQFTVTGAFQLVQGNRGVVMIWPVFALPTEGREERVCRGFIQTVFRVDEMLAQTHLRSPAAALDMLYIDASASSEDVRKLYFHAGSDRPAETAAADEPEFRGGLHREYSLELGGRTWLALFRPSAGWIAEQRTFQPELWLLSGLFVTLLIAGFLASIARRSVAVQREVTERTAELAESRRQLSNLLHALPGLACRCVPTGAGLRLVYVSEGALALTGYRAEEFLDRRIAFNQIIHPDDLAAVRASIRTALETRGDVEMEFRMCPRQGGETWALARGRGAYGEDGQLQFFDGLAIDITARKNAESEKIAIERKLLESQKLESLGLLAGGIAHDFNNLLTGIMGHASLARCVPDISADTAEHLRKIESGAGRAAELCQQMLAYSGRSHFEVGPVDLNELIRETLPLLQASLVHARLRLLLSRDAPIARGDATQLRQILMNLLLNAADALPPSGGEIVVTTGRRAVDRAFLAAAHLGETLTPGDYLFVEVRDTGCGMDQATLGKIFDPFFTTKFTGRGLGLAAVLGIARSHGGALHVQSEPQRGSTFTLLLPPAREIARSNPDSGSATPWQHHGRVLVIDDEAPVRDVAAQLVRSFGLTAETASDGTEGIRIFQANPGAYDLVVLDLTMPGLSGIETFKELRAISPEVRVLLVSGYSENEQIAGLEEGGRLVFLQKPFTRGRLERKLRELLT